MTRRLHWFALAVVVLLWQPPPAVAYFSCSFPPGASGTSWCTINNATITSSQAEFVIPVALTVDYITLYCQNPTNGITVSPKVGINGNIQSTSCTLTGDGTNSKSCWTAASINVVANQRLALGVTVSGSAGAGSCTVSAWPHVTAAGPALNSEGVTMGGGGQQVVPTSNANMPLTTMSGTGGSNGYFVVPSGGMTLTHFCVTLQQALTGADTETHTLYDLTDSVASDWVVTLDSSNAGTPAYNCSTAGTTAFTEGHLLADLFTSSGAGHAYYRHATLVASSPTLPFMWTGGSLSNNSTRWASGLAGYNTVQAVPEITIPRDVTFEKLVAADNIAATVTANGCVGSTPSLPTCGTLTCTMTGAVHECTDASHQLSISAGQQAQVSVVTGTGASGSSGVSILLSAAGASTPTNTPAATSTPTPTPTLGSTPGACCLGLCGDTNVRCGEITPGPNPCDTANGWTLCQASCQNP
jgi:hypothetical protein